MKCGGGIATSSMRPTCTATTGRRCASNIDLWLEHVAHRADLNYVISEMISELTVQHAYIEGGDFQLPPRPRVALPGARFELDQNSNRFRISKIFAGQNEEEIYRSPLTEVGVDVKVGDYVLAINGADLKGEDDPYRLLRNAADNPVQLTRQ